MEELSLADIVAPLKAHWLLIGIITMAVTAVVILGTYYFVPSSWKTQTSIVFEESSGNMNMLRQISSISGLGSSSTSRGEFLNVLLNSRAVRGAVVDELNLVEEFEAESRNDAIQMLADAYSSELPVSQVMIVRVTWKARPRAALSAEDRAPEMVVQVTEKLIKQLEQEVSQNDYTEAAQRRAMLEEQLQRASQELLQAEDALVKFATSEGLVSVSDQTAAIVNQLQTLQQREAELEATLNGAMAREAGARAKLSAQEQMAVSSLSESRDPAIDNLRQRIMNLEQSITEEKEVQGKSDEHPDVASLISERASAQAQLADLVNSEMQLERRSMTVDPSYSTLVAEALTNNQRVQEVRASIDGVRSRKREIMDELEQLPAMSRTYQGLRREVEMRGEAVARLTENYDLARLNEATSTTTFSVIDAPYVPDRPSGPSLKKTAVGAFAGSLLLTMLTVYWMHGSRQRGVEAEGPTEDQVA